MAKLTGKLPRAGHQTKAGPAAGLPLATIAFIQTAALADASERELLLTWVGWWFGSDVEKLLRQRIARTGVSKRAPKAILDMLKPFGFYWDEVHGRIAQDVNWVPQEAEKENDDGT